MVGLLGRARLAAHVDAVHAGAFARTVAFFNNVTHHAHDFAHGGFGIHAGPHLIHHAVFPREAQGLVHAVVEQGKVSLGHLQTRNRDTLPKRCGHDVHFAPVTRGTQNTTALRHGHACALPKAQSVHVLVKRGRAQGQADLGHAYV